MKYSLLALFLSFLIVSEVWAEQVDGFRYQPALEKQMPGPGLRHPAARPYKIVLPRLATQQEGRGQKKGQALSIGQPRDLSSFRGQAFSWQAAPQGGLTTSLSIHSPDAQALRLALRGQRLPEGIELRFFNPQQGQEVFGPYGSQDLVRTDLFWSPLILGDTLGMEVYAPTAALAQVLSLDLVQLSHIFQPFLEKSLAHLGKAGSCNIDITCRSTEAVRDAVAKIIYTHKNGLSHLCTGTLLADNDPQSTIAYFLTANHCIEDQDVADTVNTFWFFEREDCDGAAPSNVTQLTAGAELLHTATATAGTDYSLLQLQDPLPAGVYFAGWDSLPLAAGSPVSCIHHPQGDLKKWAAGDNTGFANYLEAVNETGKFLRVVWDWDEGTTEGGSSGAALFDADQRLRGTLRGGFASCSNIKGPDYYGRFDLSYPALRPWLWEGATELLYDVVYEGHISPGESKEYKISSTAAHLRIELFGLSADADLYVRRADRPTLRVYDCRPLHAGDLPETCLMENSGENTYYIRVIGHAATAFALKVSTDTLPPLPQPRSWLPALYLLLL